MLHSSLFFEINADSNVLLFPDSLFHFELIWFSGRDVGSMLVLTKWADPLFKRVLLRSTVDENFAFFFG